MKTVVTKLQKDSNLKVVYPSSDGGVFAEFKVNETEIILSPKFYKGKLYKIELNGIIYNSTYCYICAKRDFYAFIDLVKEKYGAPDSVSGKSAIWVCGRKNIIVSGLGSIQARCWIYDSKIQDEIDEQEKQQKQREISDKSEYF